jgi:hypothetical protein
LAENADGKPLIDGRNSVLNAESQRAIEKICFNSVARGITAYTRPPGETIEAQSPQVTLQKNSRAESDAISSN